MGNFSDVLEPIKAEKRRQKEEKEKRRKARQAEPFADRAMAFVKRWGIRIFYTFFMVAAMYFIILCGTLFVPPAMAYILGGLGYSLATTTEVILAIFSGLFLTAWVFVVTFFLGKKVMKIYMINMKKTMSEDAVKRLDELK